jgi:hypothetical protein
MLPDKLGIALVWGKSSLKPREKGEQAGKAVYPEKSDDIMQNCAKGARGRRLAFSWFDSFDQWI